MKSNARHDGSGDVYLVLSPDEAALVLELLVDTLQSERWPRESQEIMTALAMFLRDYLRHPVKVPPMAEDRSEAQAAA
jgi:hypothetical protein